jgi:release factor glutamine methyltransferase
MTGRPRPAAGPTPAAGLEPFAGRESAAEVDRVAEVERAVAVLRAAGVASPRADAELLAAAALGVPRWRLALTATMPPAVLASFRTMIDERARRIPLQYLIGAPFRHQLLAVGPGVFVPRPETEVVAGWAIDWLSAAPSPSTTSATPRCVDLCTGSGAVALALAGEVPAALVDAVELDPVALDWARRNVAAAPPAVARRVSLHAGDIRAGVPAGLRPLLGRVDLVVANPPYLPEAGPHVDALEPEVAGHDPALALWGGPDGLAGLVAVAALAADLLRPGGALVVEHDDSHGALAPAVLLRAGVWSDVQDHPDLAGRDRFVTALRASPAGHRRRPARAGADDE